MKLFITFLISILFSLILLFFMIIFYCTEMNDKSSSSKSSSFECGFETMTPSHIPFSFQFFLIAILFLIFDIEIALVFSFPMETNNTKNVLMIFLFISFLILGFFYEWGKGKLEWSK